MSTDVHTLDFAPGYLLEEIFSATMAVMTDAEYFTRNVDMATASAEYDARTRKAPELSRLAYASNIAGEILYRVLMGMPDKMDRVRYCFGAADAESITR